MCVLLSHVFRCFVCDYVCIHMLYVHKCVLLPIKCVCVCVSVCVGTAYVCVCVCICMYVCMLCLSVAVCLHAHMQACIGNLRPMYILLGTSTFPGGSGDLVSRFYRPVSIISPIRTTSRVYPNPK